METNTKFMWKPSMQENSFINWFVPEALAGKNGTELLGKIMAGSTPEQREKSGLCVTMQINGVEVPCEKTFIMLGEEYDRLRKQDAEDIANELFEKRLRPHAEFFEELFADIKNRLADEVKERLGIKIDPNGK